jgi:hypothetical protein
MTLGNFFNDVPLREGSLNFTEKYTAVRLLAHAPRANLRILLSKWQSGDLKSPLARVLISLFSSFFLFRFGCFRSLAEDRSIEKFQDAPVRASFARWERACRACVTDNPDNDHVLMI